ncbi:MAG TPA: hypothetical protein VMN99_01565 [Anaerolineales bacterium]|nr:hypothetical protein [Anaerolineales bacterium]
MVDESPENLLRSIFHTLAYADIFDYPLTAPEVYRYLTALKASHDEVARVLADETLFAQVDGYFTLPGREQIVETRKRRAQVAAWLWPQATRYGRMIASLPFVRMVAVTGSLAMNNTDQGKDVDYMLVTAPNRLWTCRALSLLVARFAKLEGINLCPNYLITTNALELKERSLYVAHELAQMIPLSGMDIYREIRRLNVWMVDYLPNALMEPEMPPGFQQVEINTFFQRVLEIPLRLPFANRLEKWEMNRKIERLSREQSSSFESYFSADVCKGHIDRHGENVVTAFAVRLQKATDPQEVLREVPTTKTI